MSKIVQNSVTPFMDDPLLVMFFGHLRDDLPHGPELELKRHLGRVEKLVVEVVSAKRFRKFPEIEF